MRMMCLSAVNLCVCAAEVYRDRCVGGDSGRNQRYSKIGVESELIFLRKGRSRNQFFNKRLLCLLLIIIIADCFLEACYNITFKCAILLHRKS